LKDCKFLNLQVSYFFVLSHFIAAGKISTLIAAGKYQQISPQANIHPYRRRQISILIAAGKISTNIAAGKYPSLSP
jgi:hypothetical protein